MKRAAILQSLFYIPFRVPSKGALPPGSLHRALIETGCPASRALLQLSLRVPGERNLHGVMSVP